MGGLATYCEAFLILGLMVSFYRRAGEEGKVRVTFSNVCLLAAVGLLFLFVLSGSLGIPPKVRIDALGIMALAMMTSAVTQPPRS